MTSTAMKDDTLAAGAWCWHDDYYTGRWSLLDQPAGAAAAGLTAIECNDFMLPPPRLRRLRRPLLALLPGAPPREQVAALFWDDASDADVRRSLRVALKENPKRPMTPGKAFVQIILRTAAGILAAAWLAQACFMAAFAAFGLLGAVTNGSPQGPAGALQAALGLFFLALVGGVAGGFFSLPAGLVVGVTGGLLVGLLTRLFFYPLTDRARYCRVLAGFLFLYATLSAWLVFMGLYLLLARDHVVHSPAVPWIALAAALVAGLCAGLVGRWVGGWYAAQQRPAMQQPEAGLG